MNYYHIVYKKDISGAQAGQYVWTTGGLDIEEAIKDYKAEFPNKKLKIEHIYKISEKEYWEGRGYKFTDKTIDDNRPIITLTQDEMASGTISKSS